MKITIHAPNDHVVEYVEHVAGELEDGFTSGHVDRETYWDSEEDES